MKIRRAFACFATSLFATMLLACSSKPLRGGAATPSPSPSPALATKQLVAYLNDGNLWAIKADGSDKRSLATAREGEVIQDFIWSLDGSRIYYSIGLQFFEVVLQTGSVAKVGELTAPQGVTIDRLEVGRDGKTIIVHVLDADAAARLFALTIGTNQTRELTIDGYSALIQLRPPIIRSVGELSVSPDGRLVLFKGVVGTGEELFVANIENGARLQITNLYQLSGFEESVETEGGRRVIEASWSPDGRYVIFNPMQSCSETGLCYGRLFLVEALGGAQLQLSIDMMINLPLEWTSDGRLLVYDDGSRVVVTNTKGYPKVLNEGNRPKWQPVS